MPRRRSSGIPMHMQIAQIDHSLYPPRPVQDDMMSVTTNQLDEERSAELEITDEVVLESDEEISRPEDFSPRLWQLFNRIQRRGTEPLFPADWQLDFLNIPQNLFHLPTTEFVSTRPIISSLGTFKGSEFRGKQCFERLTLLGQSVRNRIELNKEIESLPPTHAKFMPVEPVIHGDCEKFVKWAEKDGSGGRSRPFLVSTDSGDTDLNTYLVLESARRMKVGPPTRASRRTSLPSRTSVHLPISIQTADEDYMACARTMEMRLRTLASAHHRTIQSCGPLQAKDYPTVYGLAICGPRVAIVALSASDPVEGVVRTLSVCDFTDAGQDLWNAVAVAMVCLAARDEARERAGVEEYDAEVRKLMGKMVIQSHDEDQ